MTKRKVLSAEERAGELAKLDLLPQREAQRRTNALLRTMLASAPQPFTPKAKPKKRAKK